jgi:YHS domain-containing protein
MTQRSFTVWTIVALGILGTALARAGNVSAPPSGYTGKLDDRQMICMTQDTVQAKPGLAEEYKGKRYYLCCEGCRAAFEASPDRYARATDPVNGQQVDKADAPVYAYGGRAYYFSSAETQAAFAREPGRYLKGSPAP